MTLTKYSLEFDKVWQYFKKHIEWKSLSVEIVKRINFKEGVFFTLLPSSARLERLYYLESGILPPNPRIGNYEPITHLIDELSYFIHSYLSKSTKANCRLGIVEHTYGQKSDRNIVIEDVNIRFIGEKEVYYILNSENSIEQIQHAISASDVFWHFLAILTEDMKMPEKIEDNYENICNHIRYIITTAYDGEGYIFWEKTPEAPISNPLS